MHPLQYRAAVAVALKEDLSLGDVTSDSIFSNETGRGFIVARSTGVACGLPVAAEVFSQVDPGLVFTARFQDGEEIKAGDCLAELAGPVASILKGERTALNFLQRLSGTATATRAAVKAVEGTGARITDTRKTTPGLRVLEKYAVRTGGGQNHRFNLGDMVLIKDNHIRGAGSIGEAVSRARAGVGFPVKIEVEAATLADVHEALKWGVDVVMLDNMETGLMAEAVKLVDGRALVEASGGITQERLRKVADAGVNLISLGYLTHSCPSLDISLNLK